MASQHQSVDVYWLAPVDTEFRSVPVSGKNVQWFGVLTVGLQMTMVQLVDRGQELLLGQGKRGSSGMVSEHQSVRVLARSG